MRSDDVEDVRNESDALSPNPEVGRAELEAVLQRLVGGRAAPSSAKREGRSADSPHTRRPAHRAAGRRRWSRRGRSDLGC